LYSATSSSKVSRRSGDKSDKKGKILHSASVNKPYDIIHNETSYWTDEEIQRMLHDIHFSVAETWPR
jgi:hypothetical protein